jgi:hypothetical protein
VSGQTFVHEHLEFPELLTIVSERRRVAGALVEKDYWATNTLWALQSRVSAPGIAKLPLILARGQRLW